MENSVWISKLIDLGIAEFDGSVIDSPSSLTVGCDVLLEIKVRFLQWQVALSTYSLTPAAVAHLCRHICVATH